MEKAHEDFNHHTPSTFDAFKYFIWGSSIEEDNKFKVEHEVLELCVAKKEHYVETNFRIFLDRGSHEGISDTWQTKVRFLYLGRVKTCDIESIYSKSI
jgi:hypothetical protein